MRHRPGAPARARHDDPPPSADQVPYRSGETEQPVSQFTGMGNPSEDQGQQTDHYQQADQEDYTDSSADELEH